MTKQPGKLWALIQEWLDSFKYGAPSQAQIARETGVSESSLSDYKYAVHMPPAHFVVLLSQEMRVPYETVLDAVLHDHGFRGDSLRRVREELEQNGTPIVARRNKKPAVVRPLKPHEADYAASDPEGRGTKGMKDRKGPFPSS